MRKYDDEFKKNAVKKVLDGQSVASLARELGVGENLLHKWKKAKIGTSSDVEKENLELKKKLRETEMERDILKNVWLRRRSQPSKELFWHQAGRMQQMYPASVW
jgi:transposase